MVFIGTIEHNSIVTGCSSSPYGKTASNGIVLRAYPYESLPGQLKCRLKDTVLRLSTLPLSLIDFILNQHSFATGERHGLKTRHADRVVFVGWRSGLKLVHQKQSFSKSCISTKGSILLGISIRYSSKRFGSCNSNEHVNCFLSAASQAVYSLPDVVGNWCPFSVTLMFSC